MSRYASLRCEKGQTVQERLEQAKKDGIFPINASKGPRRKDIYGSYPYSGSGQMVGDITDSSEVNFYVIV